MNHDKGIENNVTYKFVQQVRCKVPIYLNMFQVQNRRIISQIGF